MTLRIRAKIEDGRWIGPPMNGRVTSLYGDFPEWRTVPHRGTDVQADDADEPVDAADVGEVLWTEEDHEIMGNYVAISHHTTEAPNESFPATYYLHMSRIDVKVGDKVAAGQQIGVEGNTGWVRGTIRDGAHLHFGVRLGDQWVDARDYLVDPDAPEDLPPALDRETAQEWLVSHYYLDGESSHGGTLGRAAPVFLGYADDGKTERWEIQLLRPGNERPA